MFYGMYISHVHNKDIIVITFWQNNFPLCFRDWLNTTQHLTWTTHVGIKSDKQVLEINLLTPIKVLLQEDCLSWVFVDTGCVRINVIIIHLNLKLAANDKEYHTQLNTRSLNCFCSSSVTKLATVMKLTQCGSSITVVLSACVKSWSPSYQ